MTRDEALRDACQERCAGFGDPPCWELDRRENVPFDACADCVSDVDGPQPEPLDPDAVVRPLL